MKIYILEYYNSCCGHTEYFISANKELALEKQKEISDSMDNANLKEIDINTLKNSCISLEELF